MSSPLPANARTLPIPDDLRATLAPAQMALFEWTDYFFQWPGADVLGVDGRAVEPLAPGLFRVRWENALGLSELQPLRAGAPLEAPLWVEVLSPKFPTPALHVAFLSALLEALFALSPHLIWSDAGATRRGARRAQTPSPLETLDWALRWGAPLQQTLAAIARQPARVRMSREVDASPAEVSELSANDSVKLTSDGARWTRATGDNESVISRDSTPRKDSPRRDSTDRKDSLRHDLTNHALIPNQRPHSRIVSDWRPTRVPQSRRYLSLDNADNRGALAFCGALANSLRAAHASRWWDALSAEKRVEIEQLQQSLNGFGAGWLEERAPVRVEWRPRAAPYRALWELEREWRGAGAPLWEGAERFARVRDVASLWEFFSFFALIKRIENARGQRAAVEANWDEERGLLAPSRALWGEWSLTFNGPAPSYSTPLRPDYLWSHNGRAVAAFDAKFRVEVPGLSGRGADLHKMHAYRDALNVRAAIALHPGALTTFFDRERGPLSQLPLRAILEGAVAGVGLWGVGAITEQGLRIGDLSGTP